MKEIEISGTGLIEEFKRRKIAADSVIKVKQGLLYCWKWYGGYAVELIISKERGRGFISGALYTTTCKPQKMADSLWESIN